MKEAKGVVVTAAAAGKEMVEVVTAMAVAAMVAVTVGECCSSSIRRTQYYLRT